LKEIQSFLGVGGMVKILFIPPLFFCFFKKRGGIRVESIEELQVIVDHFDKYPLITHKLSDYLLFKQALSLISNKEHLTIEGLNKLIAIKASINLGLSDQLKEAFPKVVPLNRPEYTFKYIPGASHLIELQDLLVEMVLLV